MGRSVVLAGAVRCSGCSLPPQWCVCDALPPVETRLAVNVLIHRHEVGKPSSTGMLVTRAVRGAVSHTYQHVSPYFSAAGFPADARDPGRELWILHPSGGPLPAARAPGAAPGGGGVQILLLDGTWRQAGDMLRSVEGLGRCVRLPDAAAEPSRYWLRDQSAPGHLCTAEALVHVLEAGGEPDAARRLRLHFELHVYATLLARGRREMAERYLGHSPLLSEARDAVDRLGVR
jgi:DTW domain-containing protein YfiP